MNTATPDHADQPAPRVHTLEISDQNRDRALTALVLLLAAALRLVHLGRNGLWNDECQTAYLAGHDLGWIIGAAATDVQAPLYFIFNSLFVRTLGDAEWQVRLLSALVGVATVGLVLAIGRRLISPTAGRMAAFFLAISPMAVHYGREARGYSLTMILCLALAWAAFEAARRPTRRWALTVGALSTAMIYSHNIGPFYVAGIAAATLVCHPRLEVVRTWLVAGVIAGLGYLPWLPHLVGQLSEISTSFDWATQSWAEEFPWQVVRSLAAFTPGSPPPVRNHVTDLSTPALIGLILFGTLAVMAVVHRRRFRRPDVPAMLLMAVITPLIAVFLYSWVTGNRVYVVGRIDSAVLPLFVLAAAAGAEALRPRLRWLLPVAFAGLAILPLEMVLRLDTTSQERTIASLIEEDRLPGEVLISTTFNNCMVVYGGFDVGETLLPYPSTISDRLEWTDWTPFDDAGLLADAEAVVQRSVDISRVRGTSRIWLLVGGDPQSFAVAEVMDRMLKPVRRSELGYLNTEIRCYEVPNGAAPK